LKKLLLSGVLILVLNPISCAGNTASISTSNTAQTKAGSSIKAGTYQAGKDIQAGDYIVFASTSGYSSCQLMKDSSGQISSRITSETFKGNRYITVADGQYVEFTNATMLPVDQAPVLQPTNGKYPEGMYKVGRDIAAGTYQVESEQTAGGSYAAGGAYWEIDADLSGARESIVSSETFIGKRSVTLEDGQYIKLSDCHIAL